MEIAGEWRIIGYLWYDIVSEETRKKLSNELRKQLITNRGSCRQNATDIITVRHFFEGSVPTFIE